MAQGKAVDVPVVFYRSTTDSHVLKTAELPFDDLVDKLLKIAAKGPVATPGGVVSKKIQPGWSPVRLKKGADKRANDAVMEVGALCLDFDGNPDDPVQPDLDTLETIWDGWRCWIHSTWSHTAEAPRFRVVLQLSDRLNRKSFKKVWEWAAARCAAAGLTVDQQTKDPSRFWYLPFQRGPFVSRLLDGEPLDVPEIVTGMQDAATTGAPSGWDGENTEVFRTDSGPMDIAAWAAKAKVGEKVQGFCPIKDDSTAGSAFLRRFKGGALICCTSPHHGHRVPLKRWWADPADDTNAAPQADRSLVARLQWKHDKEGKRVAILPSLTNLELILEEDAYWKNRLWYDGFRETKMFLDWDGEERAWRDEDLTHARIWFEQAYGVAIGREAMWDAVSYVAKKNVRNPLTEELDTYQWDGVERIDTWLTTAMGVIDTPLHRAIARKTLIQAVARAYKPGCQADTVLILVGKQGCGKSTAIRALAGSEWFSCTRLKMNDKDAYMQLQSVWIYELGELASVRASQVELVKAFVTSKEDRFRPPYGRESIVLKRHTVFMGTTNEDEFLNDATGERRYWPVRVSHVDLKWIEKHRRVLWAEAVRAFKAGEQWHLNRVEEQQLGEVHEEFKELHPWEARIRTHLEQTQIRVVETDRLMTSVLGIPVAKQSRGDQMTLAQILGRLEFRRMQVRTQQGGRRWVYVRHLTGEQAKQELEAQEAEL